MFKKVKRMMAFLLTLVVVASLVYQDGYRALAQELVPQEQSEAQALSEEIPDEPEAQEPVPQEPSDQPVAAEPTPGTEDSGTGTEENVSETDIPDANAPEADAGTEENVSQNPAPTEEPEAESAGDQDAGAQPEQTPAETPTETPTAAPTETPAATPEPSQEPTKAPEEVVLTEQTLSVSTGDATVTLQGVMPENASVQAVPVQVSIEGQEVLAAYDITIYDAKGQVYQPQEGAIKVDITNAAVAEARASQEEVSVYHMENAASAPQEVAAAPEGNGVTFQAESFSIYVVTTPEKHFTATYNFYDNDGNLINQQILSSGEILQRPQTPEVDNQKFTGWYVNNQKFADSKFGQFAEVLEGLPQGTELKEDVVYELHPGYTDVFYVYYKSANTADSSILYTQTYTDGNAQIITKDVPFVAEGTKALIGWTTVAGGTEPMNDLRLNGADVTLYPVVAEAAWITFDSQGGTSVDPVYVLAGQKTTAPEDPTRQGYEFAGWYVDEKCTDRFNFGGTLDESITLYAKWEAQRVNYTIVYWQENPDDDGYSFYESETGRGMTGELTDVQPPRAEDGFHASDDPQHQVIQQTIAGDGSTIVNVYYDRDVYEVTFQNVEKEYVGWWPFGHYEYTTTPITDLTISAKYGANISALWPSRRTGLSENYPSMWSTNDEEPGEGPYQAGIETMPLGGDTFYYVEQSGRQYRSEYYVQDLNGGTYTLHHTDNWRYNGQLSTTEEDYYDIPGFTVNMKKSPREGASAERLWGNNRDPIYGWKFYYDRNSYNIEFHSEGDTVRTETYKYEADISGLQGYEPNRKPAGKEDYEFAGWYTNEACLGEPYNFAGKTMPANNLILYTKWVAPTYTVTFDLNGGQPLEGNEEEYKVQTVDKGGKAMEPTDPVREGYTFAGWTRNGSPFSFETQITEDTTLVAQWISEASYTLTYDPNGGILENGGSAEPFTDEDKYVDGADAKLQAAPESWKAPEEGKGFICWNTQPDGSGQDYYPGDVYKMPAENVILYAKWAPSRKTTLTYNYNGGSDAEGHESDTVEIDVPNEEYAIPVDRDGSDLTYIADPSYVFVGWTINADGTGDVLKPGDRIQVDTLKPETNVLYAKWEKRVTVTVKKTVDGNMGDRNAEFDFTYCVKSGEEEGLTDSFSLKNGETKPITGLKRGDQITVTETSAGMEGYQTIIKVNGQEVAEAGANGTYTYTVPEEGDLDNITIEFINKRCVVPPTGLSDNMAPFAAMTLAGLGAAAIFFLPRRRRQ